MNNAVPIPDRIARLSDLADNLWWSWHRPARNLFKAVSYPLWKGTRHNTVQILQLVSPQRLESLARDPHFLRLYDQVVAEFDAEMSDGHLWFSGQYPDLNQPVAYFSAEFGLHGSLPIYSGGLGVLSGDHCKEVSDLGLPFVGVGFIYPQGYFRQRIPPDGWQEAVYDTLNFDQVPIHPVFDSSGNRLTVQVTLRGAPVHVQVWQLRIGRVNVYLMDANVPQNAPWDPAGNGFGPGGSSCAASIGYQPRCLAHERGPLGLFGTGAAPGVGPGWPILRRGRRRGEADHGIYDPHSSSGRTRCLSLSSDGRVFWALLAGEGHQP
jgi:hypothetical protein